MTNSEIYQFNCTLQNNYALQNNYSLTENVIYLTDDPNLNQLTLSIKFESNKNILFKKNDSIFSLNFSFLSSSPNVIKNLKITSDFWKSTFQDDDFNTWNLQVTNDLELKPSEQIQFTIDNIKVDVQSSDNVGDIKINYIPLPQTPEKSIVVSLINPPSEQLEDLDWKHFHCQFDDDYKKVFVTNESPLISNKLKLVFSNPQPISPLVSPDKQKTGESCFIIYFIAGDDLGCLATKEKINGIGINVSEVYGNYWHIPPSDNQSDIKTWKLIPKDKEVLGTRKNALATFDITNIQSEAVIGTTEQGITLMYIQYLNIPGYNDGVFSLAIEKQLLTISKLEIIEKPIYSDLYPDFPAITLAWETMGNPDFCLLSVSVKNELITQLVPPFTLKNSGLTMPLNILSVIDYFELTLTILKNSYEVSRSLKLRKEPSYKNHKLIAIKTATFYGIDKHFWYITSDAPITDITSDTPITDIISDVGLKTEGYKQDIFDPDDGIAKPVSWIPSNLSQIKLRDINYFGYRNEEVLKFSISNLTYIINLDFFHNPDKLSLHISHISIVNKVETIIYDYNFHNLDEYEVGDASAVINEYGIWILILVKEKVVKRPWELNEEEIVEIDDYTKYLLFVPWCFNPI